MKSVLMKMATGHSKNDKLKHIGVVKYVELCRLLGVSPDLKIVKGYTRLSSKNMCFTVQKFRSDLWNELLYSSLCGFGVIGINPSEIDRAGQRIDRLINSFPPEDMKDDDEDEIHDGW